MPSSAPRRVALAAAFAAMATLPACDRKKPADVNPIVPKIEVNRTKAPLGSAVELTYTWTLEPGARKPDQDYRALVHFLDSHQVMLFDDDHVPTPPPSQWEPGKTYTYKRTKFIPVYHYVGEAEVRMGLYPAAGRGDRVAMKGDDAGMHEYRVAKIELQPQTENIFLVYKDGWHNPETSAHNPAVEQQWTKKEALVSFKNPKKDIVVYLEADTNTKAFDAPPSLTLSVGKAGFTQPIESPEPWLKRVRVKAEDLGTDEWTDLRLSMSSSFVPKDKGVNSTDDRELGLRVTHLYVVEADRVGAGVDVVDAAPLPSPAPPAPAKAGAKTTAKK